MPRIGPKTKLGRPLSNAERMRLKRFRESGRVTDDMDPIYVLGLISLPGKRGRPALNMTQAEQRRLRRIKALKTKDLPQCDPLSTTSPVSGSFGPFQRWSLRGWPAK